MWIISKNLLCSLDREAEFSADAYLAGQLSVQWSATLTPRQCSSPDKTTVCSTLSRFGMTFERLTESRGEELLTSCLEDFRAKTSRVRERERESTESAPDYGKSSHASFARFDLATHSWRTAQCCFLGVSDEFSETWPKSGMMRNGACWARTTSELHTGENGYGSSRRTPDGISFFHTPCTGGLDGGSNSRKAFSKRFLTPMASEGLRSNFSLEVLAEHWRIKPKSNLSEQIAFETAFPTPRTKGLCGGSGNFEALKKLQESGTISDEERRSMAAGNGGSLNPTWVEWLMGWPIGWTDLGA